jgi:lysophospholipase L1-like esterase
MLRNTLPYPLRTAGVAIVALAAAIALSGATSAAGASVARPRGLAIHSAAAPLGVTQAAAAPLGGVYVALGDSYTSGPGIPNQIASSALCARSDHNYPSLIAQAIQPASFIDVSCAGAVTDNMTSPQGLAAPQFNALSPADRLVTVGIGGNDANFAGVAVTCIILGTLNPTGAPCKANYTSGGTDQIAALIDQTAPKIAAVLQGIHQRAPYARVLLIGYPDILPASVSLCAPGVNDPLAPGDVPWLNSEEQRMNQMLASQAAAGGATYVDTYTSSVGHDACQLPGTRYIEGIVDVQNAIPIHPNALGMQNDARQILAALNH